MARPLQARQARGGGGSADVLIELPQVASGRPTASAEAGGRSRSCSKGVSPLAQQAEACAQAPSECGAIPPSVSQQALWSFIGEGLPARARSGPARIAESRMMSQAKRKRPPPMRTYRRGWSRQSSARPIWPSGSEDLGWATRCSRLALANSEFASVAFSLRRCSERQESPRRGRPILSGGRPTAPDEASRDERHVCADLAFFQKLHKPSRPPVNERIVRRQ